MRYRAGTRPQNGGRWAELELEDSDMTEVPGWENLSLGERYKAMALRAELLMVSNLLAHGDISSEYAESRVRHLREVFG